MLTSVTWRLTEFSDPNCPTPSSLEGALVLRLPRLKSLFARGAEAARPARPKNEDHFRIERYIISADLQTSLRLALEQGKREKVMSPGRQKCAT